jgi:hypothetical protein
MEIFCDFGLSELIVANGLAALSRTIYSRRLMGTTFLLASIAASALLVALAIRGSDGWLPTIVPG